MIHHFIHLLEGLGAAIAGISAVIGWFAHMTWHRARFGKGAHKRTAA